MRHKYDTKSLSRLIALCVGLLTTGCATQPLKTTLRQRDQLRTAPAAVSDKSLTAADDQAGDPDEVKVYLQWYEKQLTSGWVDGVVGLAAQWLPKSHPANLLSRWVEIGVDVDHRGRITRSWVNRKSGYHRFDNSALSLFRRIKKTPGLPQSLRGQHVSLLWRFHRDSRACQARYARVKTRRKPAAERLQDALARRDFPAAKTIVAEHGRQATVRRILANHALATKGNTDAGLLVATSEHLGQLLIAQSSPALLARVVAELVRRRAKLVLQRSLSELLNFRTGSWKRRRRIIPSELFQSLLSALAKTKGHIGGPLFDQLVQRYPDLVADAALLLDDEGRLKSLTTAFAHEAEISGPAAARLLQRGAVDAALATLVVRALASRHRLATLRILSAAPIARFATHLEQIVRNGSASGAARALAIEVLSRLGTGQSSFRSALRSRDQTVQMAAIRALSRSSVNKLSTSYQLARLGYADKGAVSAAALAAIATINHERFRWDVLRLLKRQQPEHQLEIVRQVWRFGSMAVKTLQTVVERSGQTELLAATRATLLRIGSPRALKVAARLEQKQEQLANDTANQPQRQTTTFNDVLQMAASMQAHSARPGQDYPVGLARSAKN